jgi:adenosylcobinamide-GDP ribazoletransferase
VRDAVRLTFGTLTRLPVRPPHQLDRRTAAVAMVLAPVTAVPPALAIVGLHVLTTWRLPAFAAAVLGVALTAWWSRGLHLDGLADTADGLGSGYDRDRTLEVMHRADVGPMGVATVVLVLLLQVTTLGAALPRTSGTALAAVALLASRACLAAACWRRIPAARATGLGATVAGTVGTAAMVVTTLVSFPLAAAIALLGHTAWFAGPLVVLAAALGAGLVLGPTLRRIRGITGDVLGASVEVAFAAGLVAATLLA